MKENEMYYEEKRQIYEGIFNWYTYTKFKKEGIHEI